MVTGLNWPLIFRSKVVLLLKLHNALQSTKPILPGVKNKLSTGIPVVLFCFRIPISKIGKTEHHLCLVLSDVSHVTH